MKSESEFVRGPDSYNIIRSLGNSCAIERAQCFKMISKNIDSWFLGFGSPNLSFMENSTEACSSHNNSMHYLIEQLLPDLLRLSLTAPYNDVRENCHSLLVSLERRNFRIPRVKHIGQSHFMSLNKTDDLIYRNGESAIIDEDLNSLLAEHFEEWGRIENYITLMSCHPTYLEQYLKVYNHLFRGDGSLPYLDRYYVAIMAAAQMHCRELIYRFITEFLAAGGDSTWLMGLHKAPGRLKALSVLNQYLCHQPWQIDPKNLEQLTRCPENMYHISKSQLLQAVIIMTHVYSLSTFMFGCGINNEIDHPLALTVSTSYLEGSFNSSRNARSSEDFSLSMSTDSSFNESVPNNHNHHSHSDMEDDRMEENQDDCPIEVIMERLREAQEDDDELAEAEVVKMFLSVEKENETIIQNLNHPANINPLIERFVGDPNFGYVNFNSKAFNVMRMQDYSWCDEGCCLADRIYPDIGTILERKFNCSYELTYNMMGDMKNIDTTLFRMSVWIYVHSLYGIRHDDFNYAQLDQLLTKPLKLFLKKSITKPCTITKSDFLRFLPEFKFSEKTHVALMAADARQQACLLYVLRSI